MKYYVEWRLRGDDYDGAFGNGHTLSNSESVQNMKKISHTDDLTVFQGAHGHIVKCFHKQTLISDNKQSQNRSPHSLPLFASDNFVTYCTTVFENTSGNPIAITATSDDPVATPTTAATPATLELLSSFAIKDIKADRIHRATSFWSAEGKLLSQDLTELNMEPSWANFGIRIEKFGQIGSMPVRKWFPFLVLEDSKNSHFIGIQLYCASSWQIEILRQGEDIIVHGGIADRDFGSWFKTLMPGEKFETPKAVIAEGSSLEEVCDKLVKAQDPRIAEIDKDMPVIFNEYCTTWGNPTLDNIKKIAKRLEGSGVRYLVIDCGWYKPDDAEWHNAIGDWIPNKTYFPNGIKEAADFIRSCGMIPGIWFEYENTASAAEAYHNTDHLLSRDGYPVTVGSRRFWDMRDPWVRDYLDEKVIRLLKEAGFGYIKIDYNENIGAGVDTKQSQFQYYNPHDNIVNEHIDPSNLTNQTSPANIYRISPGEGLRQTIEASRNYLKHLAAELHDLVIENCSAGGHRLEPSYMELVSQASFSDAHECTSIPLIAANLHRLIRPEQSQIWAVLHASADEHRINYLLTSAYLGRLCLSGEIFELTDKQWGIIQNGIQFYDRIKHIIKSGFTSVIRTNVKDYSKPEGYQAVLRTYNDEALLIVHTFRNGANPPIDDLLAGYTIKECFGSELDDDFRGKVYFLNSV